MLVKDFFSITEEDLFVSDKEASAWVIISMAACGIKIENS